MDKYNAIGLHVFLKFGTRKRGLIVGDHCLQLPMICKQLSEFFCCRKTGSCVHQKDFQPL